MHRGWRDNPIFKGEFSRSDAWVWLIENACWKPTRFDVGGHTITLNRGQLCASVRQLADTWGWSKSSVERFLTRLKTETMVELEPKHGKNIITVCNYGKYQDIGEVNRDSSGTATGTPARQQRDIKEQGNKETREQLKEESYDSSSARGGSPEGSPAKGLRKISAPTPLPEAFQPNLGPKRAAMVDAWPDGMFEEQLERFRAHALRNQRLSGDWDTAFGTWVDRADKGLDAYGYRPDGWGQRNQMDGAIACLVRRIRRDGFSAAIDEGFGLVATR